MSALKKSYPKAMKSSYLDILLTSVVMGIFRYLNRELKTDKILGKIYVNKFIFN